MRLIAVMSERPTSHRAAREQLHTMYRAVADARDVAVASLGAATHTPATVPVALVPYSDARTRVTAARRHAMLATRIRELLATMHATSAEQDDGFIEQPAPLSADATRVVIAVCSACRGHCCRNGREHAYLRVRTLRDYVDAHPQLTDDEVVQAYLAHLPVRALHPGCVYQGLQGCTLPREMRSAICNSYLCTGLQMAVDSASSETAAVFVAHRHGLSVSGGKLRALPVLG